MRTINKNNLLTLSRYKNLKRNKAETEAPTLQSPKEGNYDLLEIEQNNDGNDMYDMLVTHYSELKTPEISTTTQIIQKDFIIQQTVEVKIKI